MLLNKSNFILEEIPHYLPILTATSDYIQFWREQKRRCIEGYWSSGMWCPPQLYFYLNFWHIKVSEDVFSGNKKYSFPFFRELEWQKAYMYTEASGFCGFELDEEFTCHTWVRDWDPDFPRALPSCCYRQNGTLKTYVDARGYMQQFFPKSLGKPIYKGEKRNIVDIEARECFGRGTRVRMFDGSTKAVEDIREGDQLMGPDSTKRTVQWTHSGVDQLYRIKQSNGMDYVVNGNHWVTLRKRKPEDWVNEPEFLTITAADLYQKDSNFLSHYVGWRVPLEYPEREVAIDPYFLGLWLGDGNSGKVGITSIDSEIVDYVYAYAQANDKIVNINRNSNKECPTYILTNGNVGGSPNSVLTALRDYNLLNNKHIPQDFLTNSREIRLQVLAGLVDTDGYYAKRDNYYEITQKSYRLAKDIETLATSLGFRTSFKEVTKGIKSIGFTGTYYKVGISGNLNEVPVLLPRKKARPAKKRMEYSTLKVEKLDQGEFYGCHVDGDSLILLEDNTLCSNTGKSYWASACIAHNFLFDGYVDYDDFLLDQQRGVLNASETLVGSIDTKYSDDLLKKVQDGIRLLPWEERNVRGEKVPAFFNKETTGSWKAGPNPILANFEHKVAGGWLTGGSQSKIHHRSMGDDLAGNGTRPNKIFIEEVGFQGNLLDLLGALRDCTTTSGVKIGSIIMMGTGGDMKGGATEKVQEVFYNPEEFDCVSFEDTWEHTGKKIGFFANQPMADNEYLDKATGKIDYDKGYKKSMIRRDKLRKGKNKTAYNKEMENKPLIPSEAFLVTNSNRFPIAQLKDQLGIVQTTTDARIKGQLGWVIRNEEGLLTFKPDLTDELRMPDYPIRRGDNDKKKARDTETEGAVHIWELPKSGYSYGHYASGLDPYEKEEAVNSISIGSFFIIERGCLENGGYDRIVAEYTGRPDSGTTEFYTNCMNLIEFYNSHECLYESNVNQFKGFLENRHKLHLLAFTPGVISNRVKDSNSSYGVYVGNKKVKNELLQHGDDMLRKQVDGDGKLQLQYIYSPGLLKELIAYNDEGNFDRVIAFCCAVTQSVQLETVELAPKTEQAPSVFAGRKFFTNRTTTSGYPTSSPSKVRKPQHVFHPSPAHGR